MFLPLYRNETSSPSVDYFFHEQAQYQAGEKVTPKGKLVNYDIVEIVS